LESADDSITTVLAGDYPNFALQDCSLPTGHIAFGTATRIATCGTPPNSTTLQFKVEVSYWYYLDTDDFAAPRQPFSATADVPSHDSLSLDGTNLTGYATACTTNSNIGYGLVCPDNTAADKDDLPTSAGGPGTATPSTLVCPTTGNFGRLVRVQLWTQFLNPFRGVLRYPSLILHSTQQAVGCQA
jgi:hypothetical protein